jgi:hypothetical protein
MNPATGIAPHRVMGWKRLTDDRLGIFGLFMATFCWPLLVSRHTGLSLWVHGVIRRMLQPARKKVGPPMACPP